MLDLVKVGGYVIVALIDLYVDASGNGCNYKSNLDQLLSEGRVELTERIQFKKYEGYDSEKAFGQFEEMGGSVMVIKRLK